MSSSPTPLKLKLVLVLFGLTLGLGALEIASRLVFPRTKGTSFSSLSELRASMLSDEREPSEGVAQPDSVSLRSIINPHPDDHLIYDLRPSLDVRFQRSRLVTNSCAMRDSEDTESQRLIRHPSNTFRIALLGDSFAFGWGVDQANTYGAALERLLNETSARVAEASKHTPLHFEVLNFGVPGYSTFQESAIFTDRVTDFQPDAVLLYWVENDFGLPFFVRDIAEPGGLLSGMEFVSLAKRALSPELEEQKLALQGLDPNTALRQLADATRAHGIPLFLFPNPKQQWRKDKERLWILRERPDIRTIDVVDELRELLDRRAIKKEDLTLTFDPHPSPLKHELTALLTVPYFLENM